MSLSTDRSTALRIQKEINELQRRQAAEMKQVADAMKSMNSATSAASRASSPSSAQSHLNTANREAKKVEGAQGKAAQYGSEISRKTDELSRVQTRIANAEEKDRRDRETASAKQRRADEAERRKLRTDNTTLARDLASLKSQLTAAIETQAASTQPFVVENAEGQETPYDFFISHAWADKEDFVDGLVERATAAGLLPWYDNDALTWGDSIRQKIDDGLRRSYFGVVVLSPSFFERAWTQYELDAIVQRDLSGSGRLLPIWHRLTHDEVVKHAPSLAGRLAMATSNYSTDQIVAELLVMRDKFKRAAS